MAQNYKSYLANISLHTRAMLLNGNNIILDIGANQGLVTKSLAKVTKAKIYAYEPDPVPFQELTEVSYSFRNVTAINEGVSEKNGLARLYLHKNSVEDRLLYSTGSSLCYEKNNISSDYVDIYCRDIVDIIKRFKHISLLKLDVEGAETQILKRLIETGYWKCVDKAYVETHEQKMNNEYKEQLSKIKKTVKELNWKVNYDWK